MTREPRGWMVFTSFVALFLSVLPLPRWLDIVRPAFVVLAVLYFSITWPRAGGIGLGFFSGLALDAFQGPVLGQHALALSPVTYIAVREHQRIRSKPAFQQSLIVFFALLACTSSCSSSSTAGRATRTRTRAAGCTSLTGALIWPHRHRAAGARPLAAMSYHGPRRHASRITGASSASSISAR